MARAGVLQAPAAQRVAQALMALIAVQPAAVSASRSSVRCSRPAEQAAVAVGMAARPQAARAARVAHRAAAAVAAAAASQREPRVAPADAERSASTRTSQTD